MDRTEIVLCRCFSRWSNNPSPHSFRHYMRVAISHNLSLWGAKPARDKCDSKKNLFHLFTIPDLLLFPAVEQRVCP
jgi:hypothetical protein